MTRSQWLEERTFDEVEEAEYSFLEGVATIELETELFVSSFVPKDE